MADSVTMDMSGDWAAQLDRLGEGIKEKVLRSGGNAASEVFQLEAKARAPVYRGRPKDGVKPGQLRDSIYRVFSEDASGDAVAVYQISWNARKAPHGHLLEYGTSRAPAYPFIRPAYDAAKERAGQAGIARMSVRMQELMTELRT